MTDRPLDDLEQQRDRLYEQLAATGDFRSGSISENYRRCGKPNCACAQPDHPGHGPRYLWTRTVAGRGTRGRQLAREEVEKVRRELAGFQRFATLSEQLVEVNEAICEARPPDVDAPISPTAGTEAEKGGLRSQIEAEVTEEVARLTELTVASLGPSGGLEAVETAIRAAMLRLGGSILQQLLDVDAGHRGPRVDCANGHLAQFVSYRDKTIETVLGTVTVRRAYYHCVECGAGVVPRDGELGVTDASMPPGLRKMTARAAAAVPFAIASGLLAELAGIRLPTKRIERAAEADGAAASDRIAAESTAILAGKVAVLPPAEVPDMLYLAVDGTAVPMVPAATTGRTGKGADGRARTREVELACLFTQTTIDEQARPVRDPDSTSYLASFSLASEFATLVHAEARRRGVDHIRQIVVLGDGAPWIWLATAILPEATPIVDLYHAREHPHTLAAQLAAALGDKHPAWLEARLADLDAGDIEALVAETNRIPLADIGEARERERALAYFKTNAHRMRYAYFRDRGMFVGSGAVEAGCKDIVGQRLKLSGMRWNVHGATGILTLRCQHASNRWDQIWTADRHDRFATAGTRANSVGSLTKVGS